MLTRRWLLPLVLLSASALDAQNLLVYEPFRDGVSGTNVGDLDGQNGGFGWGGAWIGPRQLPTIAAWWPLEADADFVQYAVDGVGLPVQLVMTEGLQVTVLR